MVGREKFGADFSGNLELKGSAWDGVPLQAVLNMTTGLNADDMSGAMFNAGSMEQRYYQASFGDLYNGKKENWLDQARWH